MRLKKEAKTIQKNNFPCPQGSKIIFVLLVRETPSHPGCFRFAFLFDEKDERRRRQDTEKNVFKNVFGTLPNT